MNKEQLLLISLILIRGHNLSGWWVCWAVLIYLSTSKQITIKKGAK